MKLAIIGSRNFHDYKLLSEVLETYKNKVTLVISGAAIGADSLGEKQVTFYLKLKIVV